MPVSQRLFPVRLGIQPCLAGSLFPELRSVHAGRDGTVLSEILGHLDESSARTDNRCVGRTKMLFGPIHDGTHAPEHRAILDANRGDACEAAGLLRLAIEHEIVV